MKLPTFIKAISAALLALAVSAPALHAYSGEHYVTCNLNPNGDNFLALRTCGSSKCPMIMKLAPDTFLISMEPNAQSRWREVIVLKGLQDENYSGPSGWVYDKYICGVSY